MTPPTLRAALARAALHVGIWWSGITVAAVVVYLFPPYARFYA